MNIRDYDDDGEDGVIFDLRIILTDNLNFTFDHPEPENYLSQVLVNHILDELNGERRIDYIAISQ